MRTIILLVALLSCERALAGRMRPVPKYEPTTFCEGYLGIWLGNGQEYADLQCKNDMRMRNIAKGNPMRCDRGLIGDEEQIHDQFIVWFKKQKVSRIRVETPSETTFHYALGLDPYPINVDPDSGQQKADWPKLQEAFKKHFPDATFKQKADQWISASNKKCTLTLFVNIDEIGEALEFTWNGR